MKHATLKGISHHAACATLAALAFAAPARATEFAAGDGSAASPYEIATAAELAKFRDIVNGANGERMSNYACAKLTADIDLAGESWSPIGDAPPGFGFFGTFDGQGHVIGGLSVNRQDSSGNNVFAGLFSVIDNHGTVKNLGVCGDIAARGGGDYTRCYAGGVAGYNSGGTVEGCFHVGSVSASGSTSYGYNYAGGIVGANEIGGTVRNCRHAGSVASEASGNPAWGYSGGVVGYNDPNGSAVLNCYAVGAVTATGNGSKYAGGVAGYNYSTVENCHYDKTVAGAIGAVRGEDTVGATGKTTAEMQGTNALSRLALNADSDAWTATAGYPELKAFVAGAADATKGFAIRTYYDVNHSSVGVGESTRTISAEAIAAGDVTVPCAVYYIENTNSTKGLMVGGTVSSSDGNAGNIKFVSHETGTDYFASAEDVNVDGTTGSTKSLIGFAGVLKLNKKGTTFVPDGSGKYFVEESQSFVGTPNAFFSCVWICGNDGYRWSGEKSDAYPLYVFEVVLGKGTPAGTYKVDFCEWDTDPTDGNEVPSPMVEGLDGTVYTRKKGNLTLSGLTIIVEGATPVSTLAGDANCDGKVDLSDAILINQALDNPDKYGVNGSDPTHITAQGMINADVDGSAGVANGDALQIQYYLVKAISGFARTAQSNVALSTTNGGASSGVLTLSPTLKGDANLDGKVSISDVTAIMQSLGNPDKYQLQAQGRANADVDPTVTGVSPGDAYRIQQLDAHIITEL